MKTFKIHLVRHGLTQGNINGVYVGGGSDLPLCEQGKEQLRNLAAIYRYPTAPLVFCSPMLRARETAKILFPDIKECIVMEDLRENIFGEFEGKSAAELIDDPKFKLWLDPKSEFVPSGGESGKSFAQRVDGALSNMLTYMVKNNIYDTICVSHGGVFMTMLAQRALPQRSPQEWMCDNGCGYTIQSTTALMMRDGIVEAVEVVPRGYLD